MYSFVLAANRSLPLAALLAVTVLSGPRAHAQPGWVLSHQKISDTEGGFTGTLDNGDRLGISATPLGDLDGDGVGDLAVGAYRDDDGGDARGAVWILFFNTDGTVKSHQKISDIEGGFKGILDDGDNFGFRMASLGDLDGDGPSVLALAVGAQGDDDGDFNHGAVWILFLNVDTTGRDPIVTVKSHHKISDTSGDLPPGALDFTDNFGTSVAALGDLDGDGVGDLAVGAWHDDDGGTDRGAVWILFLNADGTVNSHQKISSTAGGGPPLNNGDDFGSGVDSLGDLDGDGVGDLAVGAWDDDDGGGNHGAVWVLFLNTNGTVKSYQKISDTEGGFTGILDETDQFGTSVASLGDLDGDGVGDLAVGAYRDDDGGFNRGAVWVLFLNTNGTVKSHQKISDTQGGFTDTLDDGDFFGTSVAALGDLDGDGVGDLAVGAYRDDDGGPGRGAVWVLFLDGVSTIDLALDIKPGSCPNSFNRNSNGVLPVALVGTDDFDVTEVDLASIVLVRTDGVGGSIAPHEGPPGPHSEFEDVATPFDGETCDCHDLEGDGFLDLSMHFLSDEVVEALQLNDLPAGDLVELVVSGTLLDGTEFSASDCIRLVPPGTPPGMMAVGSNAPGVFIDVSPLDLQLDGGGFANFERTFPLGSVVTLTAPQEHQGRLFVGWNVTSALPLSRPTVLDGGTSIDIMILGDQQTIEAIYEAPSSVLQPPARRLR